MHKVDNLAKIFTKMNNVSHVSTSDMSCSWCGGAHLNGECTNTEKAQFVSNYNRSQNDT